MFLVGIVCFFIGIILCFNSGIGLIFIVYGVSLIVSSVIAFVVINAIPELLVIAIRIEKNTRPTKE